MSGTLLPYHVYPLLQRNDPLVLLETSRFDRQNFLSYLFLNPLEELHLLPAGRPEQFFEQIEYALKNGFYVAGYLTYEFGHMLEPALPPVDGPGSLAWFGIFAKPHIFDHRRGEWVGEPPPLIPDEPLKSWSIKDFKFSMSRQAYDQRIDRVKSHIAAGDSYQINFTGKLSFDFSGDEASLYASMRDQQRVSYGAWIRHGGQTILCASPELFFRLDKQTVEARPMKGTVRRGRTLDEDRQLREWLCADEKSRAENVMIVDLLRNDIGRISLHGSVKVPSLFDIETYDSLLQMTSTVRGRLRKGTNYEQIFRSLFPCGSITGAPKIRSMQLIRQLEGTPRGIYTGSIGMIAPDRKAVFNVAIRTVILKNGRGEMGSGGGIVWDSDAASEWQEVGLKAAFLMNPLPRFDLIETMRWQGGCELLEKHLNRLTASAEYFDFKLDQDHVLKEIAAETSHVDPALTYKVRLLLSRDGKITLSVAEISASKVMGGTVIVADERVDSTDRFLYHKTTRRLLYQKWGEFADANGHLDAIFLNERGEVTEAARSNIFIRDGSSYRTPRLFSGLLNGVYRQHMLETLDNVSESVLTLQDLQDADAIYICNAVRGMRRVILNAAP